MTTTALVYIRQSKETESSVSPETQEAACRKLAAVAACGRVVVYSDLGISGGKPPEKRPGFLALRERIQATDNTHEPLVVAAYDQSRISRSNEDSAKFYAFVEERLWVDLVMVDGHFERSPSGEFTWAMMAATATHLRKLTGKKIKAAYALKNAQGISTGPAPYGYTYIGGARSGGVLQIDPQTAPVVRRIYEDYASGQFSAKGIAEALTAEKVPVRSRAGRWLPDTIVGMLGNIAYNARSYSGSRRLKSGKIIPASWPALIDDGLFQRVQDRMRARQVPITRGGRRRKREFVFRSLLWCSECDRRFVSQSSHIGHKREGSTVYYYCGSRETTAPCDHGRNAIREELLLPWVDHLMDGFEKGRISGTRFLNRPLIAKETAAEAVAKFDRQIKRLGTRFQAEELDEKEYRAELERLRRQRAIYAAQAAEDPDPKDLATLAGQWKTGDTGKRWVVLSALFEKLHVKDRHIFGYTPRADRAARVSMLVQTAFDYADDGPGADLAGVARINGAGGI